jgi:hypothetical protein
MTAYNTCRGRSLRNGLVKPVGYNRMEAISRHWSGNHIPLPNFTAQSHSFLPDLICFDHAGKVTVVQYAPSISTPS